MTLEVKIGPYNLYCHYDLDALYIDSKVYKFDLMFDILLSGNLIGIWFLSLYILDDMIRLLFNVG